jgi:hypothetical protein
MYSRQDAYDLERAPAAGLASSIATPPNTVRAARTEVRSRVLLALDE